MEKNNMIGGGLMKRNLNRCGGLFFFWGMLWLMTLSHEMRAQDVLPVCVRVQSPLSLCDSLSRWSLQTDTVQVPSFSLPSAFLHTVSNELLDSLGVLDSFWEKLRLVHAGIATDTLNIVHVGDSHIRGHIFPQTAGAKLQTIFGALNYTDMGINGAFSFSFCRPERIARIVSLKPDLLILSFGTNESHNRRYNSQIHYRQLDELVRMLRQQLPDVPILMTTPPGSYESFRQRRRRVYQVNARTFQTVRTIRKYADDNGLAVWDMYEIFGGVKRATLNWWEAGLMRPDHVHYLPAGYELQGCMFFQALLRAYNSYVTQQTS